MRERGGGTTQFFIRRALLPMTLKTERTACMHPKYICTLHGYMYTSIWKYTCIYIQAFLVLVNANQNMQNCGSILHSFFFCFFLRTKTVFIMFYPIITRFFSHKSSFLEKKMFSP